MLQNMRRVIIKMYIADAIVLILMIIAVFCGERAEEAKSVEGEKSVFESMIEIDDIEAALSGQIQLDDN